jgi:hypothetical protein
MISTKSRTAAPSWQAVEELLGELAATGATFATTSSASNRISQYDPARRLMLETDISSRWIEVASIRACWETFERLGRITRDDVLEPGRSSAFMMGLFGQVEGVEARDDPASLVLTRR